jgi:hypothetical protein
MNLAHGSMQVVRRTLVALIGVLMLGSGAMGAEPRTLTPGTAKEVGFDAERLDRALKFVQRAVDSGRIFASGLNGPVGLAFDGSGNLFVSSDTADQSIMRFTPDGLGTVFTTTPDYPTGLAFDSSGNLYAGHDGDGLIDEFSPDGSRTTFSTSGSDTISFIAIRSAVVPEPSSFVLSVVGLSGLICRGLVCRRDRGASASSR